jgi:hypothetical protein
MFELYHLSHFFEFLTGVYFGGFAILNFLQKDATASFKKNVEHRKLDAINAKTQVHEYFKIRITITNGHKQAKDDANEYSKWCEKEKIVAWVLDFTNFIILDIVSQKGYFIKRYFPAFFFNGLFCITIILFSGFAQTHPTAKCQYGIDLLFTFFCVNTILFQIWSLFIFPFKVTNRNYLALTIINILIVMVGFGLSFILSDFFNIKFGLDTFLLPEHAHWLILLCLLISVVPLLYIIFLSIIMIFLWYWSNTFYLNTLEKMKKQNPISLEIQRLANI